MTILDSLILGSVAQTFLCFIEALSSNVRPTTAEKLTFYVLLPIIPFLLTFITTGMWMEYCRNKKVYSKFPKQFQGNAQHPLLELWYFKAQGTEPEEAAETAVFRPFFKFQRKNPKNPVESIPSRCLSGSPIVGPSSVKTWTANV
jgi:hypothetical protein